MDYQATKKKVVSWCEELEKEGVISKDDLDRCNKSFVSFGTDLTVQKHPEAKTNKQHSFGMNKLQGVGSLGEDLTTKKYIQCFFKTKYGFTKTDRTGELVSEEEFRHLTIRNGITNKKEIKTELFLASDKEKDIVLSRFVIALQDNGYYTIMNYGTGNYIKIESNKSVSIDTNNITDGTYFSMKTKGKYNVFIPRIMPEYKLTPDVNRLILSDGIRQEHNWLIDELPTEEEIDMSEDNINTITIKDTIQKLISKIMKTRYEYYTYLAQIEFLKLLETKIRNVVKPNGDVMNDFYSRRDDATSDERKILTEQLLKSISFSIKDEIENREVADINEVINDLIIEAQKFKAENLTKSDNELNKLIRMLNEQIDENKRTLEQQRGLISFYNKEQKILNSKNKLLIDELKDYNNKELVNNKNYDIVTKKTTYIKYEYYYYIAIIIFTIILLGFYGYKLYNRITDIYY
jgi:hypothetical protein